MINITDRELLIFCSLAKLKLEFSQYKNYDEKKKLWEYKTIRQLIDLEIAGQKVRKKNQDQSIVELRMIEEKINKKINDDITASGTLGTISPELNDQMEDDWKIYHEKVKEIMNANIEKKEIDRLNLGIFYNNSELGRNPFPYKKTDDLRTAAPMIMQYFDLEKKDEEKNQTFISDKIQKYFK